MSGPASAGAIEGRIDPARPIQTHLARALFPLLKGKRTGALQLAIAGERTQLVIADGQLVFAESETDAGAFLEALARAGAIEASRAADILMAVLEARGWSGLVKASELTVTEGRVPPNVALQAISETVRARVLSSLVALEGEWAYRDDPRAGSVPRYPVQFEKTVLEALAHPACAPHFAQALERYARHYPRLEGDKQESSTLFGMTPARLRTLRLLDGAHALTEVLAQSPMGAMEAASLIAGLTMFERIWWNPTPSPKAPTGAVPAQRAVAPRPVTMERAPAAIEELRALGRPVTQVPQAGARPPSEIRMPTPSPHAPRGDKAHSKPNAINAALVSELLRRGGAARPASQQGLAAERAPSAPKPPPSQGETLSPRGHFDRGKTHLVAGRFAAASQDFARAHELEPDDASYRLHARFAQYVQGTGDRAVLDKELVQLATARVREVEHDAFAFHVLGRLAFDQGDDERARKALKQAERLAPNDVETVRYLRILAGRMKK